ncbi:amidohydrolase family protein [Alteromonas halophila]|uniref:Amidohydrolase n=1 Tax=Alteromonas halophila TaxID=516698 RepID=A0A918JGL0_9ALTE|nr:amidohydrolase family protein [Alteromonas halophila]GGW80379.1 amidohydrolase [Alteromonas halophila]
MKIVDPHLHFFNPDEGDYHWLAPQNPPFWPDKHRLWEPALPHLLPVAGEPAVAGFVHIEAGFDNQRPWREIHWLNRVCRLPFKAVAGIDLTGSAFNAQLAALCQMNSVVGVRYILDDNAAQILSAPQTIHRLQAIAAAGLSFDAQFALSDRHAVKALCHVLEKTPALRVIINHGGVPVPKGGAQRDWRAGLKTLAQYPQVAIKLSGWEMQQRDWQWQHVQHVLETVLTHVDTSRVMLASNYPLCRWRMPYASLWQGYRRLLPPALQQPLLAANACHWYQLNL